VRRVRRAIAALIIWTIVLWPLPTLSDMPKQPIAPIDVTVQGQPFGWDDIGAFLKQMNAPSAPYPPITKVMKKRSDMPMDEQFASYRGLDSGPPAAEIVWIAPGHSEHDSPPDAGNQYLLAMTLAVLDSGGAGPKLQSLYAKATNAQERRTLARAVVQAFQSASDQSAAFAAAEVSWIQGHVRPGVSRSFAYQLLRSKGLTAYNWSFIKGKPVPAPMNQEKNGVVFGASCDTSDIASGEWPYQGERLPKQDGACGDIFKMNPPKSIANPEVDLYFFGAFDFFCGTRTHVEITFDDTDRVLAVNVDTMPRICI
jgi:hypothetical protein